MTNHKIILSVFSESDALTDSQFRLISKCMNIARGLHHNKPNSDLTDPADDAIHKMSYGSWRVLLAEIDNAHADKDHAVKHLKEICDSYDNTRLTSLSLAVSRAKVATLPLLNSVIDKSHPDEW